jgi:hypothetical protein
LQIEAKMSEMPVRDLLTEEEAAQLLAISKLTLGELRRRGLAPPHLRLPSLGQMVSRAVRYRRVDLEDFIKTSLEHASGADELNRRIERSAP